jgi:hypothetical protein
VVVELARRNASTMVVDDCLTDGDLETIVAVARELAYEDQDLGRGLLSRRQRASIEDSRIGELLWARLRDLLPAPAAWFDDERPPPDLEPPVSGWAWIGLNPYARFYRYGLGAEFSLHEDEPWRPGDGRRSLLTLLVYLPVGGCTGGETVIVDEVVAPVDGRVVMFDHRLPHAGRPVERGSKLVLRSDVVAQAENRAAR